MLHSSDSTGANSAGANSAGANSAGTNSAGTKTNHVAPNHWSWLQERVELLQGRLALGEWIAEELMDLEAKYAELVTVKSLQRDASQHLARGR